jgi:hypothetical protein
MTNAVSLFLNYPQFLIVTGTAMLIFGLLEFALFIPSDVESAEDRLAERPRLFDKSDPLVGEAEGEQAGFAYDCNTRAMRHRLTEVQKTQLRRLV